MEPLVAVVEYLLGENSDRVQSSILHGCVTLVKVILLNSRKAAPTYLNANQWRVTMHHATRVSLAIVAAIGLASLVSADVGVLDKYECHDHSETGQYHCHGATDLAKLGGVIVGLDARAQGWSTGGDKLILFSGPAVNAEYNYRWLALTGSYFYLSMVTSVDDSNVDFDKSVAQQGWEAGLKVGPGVGRLGSKVYATAGWSSAELTDSGDASNNATLAGYYVGAGFGANTRTLVFDVIGTYRDPGTVSDFLADQLGSPTDVVNFDIRVALGWRF